MADDLDRESLLAVVVGGVRSDVTAREVTRERDQVLLFDVGGNPRGNLASLPIDW